MIYTILINWLIHKNYHSIIYSSACILSDFIVEKFMIINYKG